MCDECRPLTAAEIGDRLNTGRPCCGQCGEWLKGTENYCPECGAEQVFTIVDDEAHLDEILLIVVRIAE